MEFVVCQMLLSHDFFTADACTFKSSLKKYQRFMKNRNNSSLSFMVLYNLVYHVCLSYLNADFVILVFAFAYYSGVRKFGHP